jgi:hypothetical protein
MEHVGQAVLCSQRGIPEMLLTMAEPLGEVCSVTRRLLRRGLGLQTSRGINVFFPARSQILTKEFLCIIHTVEHNYISPSSTVGIQLHVSALYMGHLQVVI